jgi:hypothetical protein
MSKQPRNPQLFSMIAKFLIGSTIIVWISSLIQLSLLAQLPFLNQILSSKSFLLIAYAWVGGLVSDVISVLFITITSLVTEKITSGIPISLVFYMTSAILYGKPSIFFISEQPILLQSSLKVVEFWLFMLSLFCHSPGIINTELESKNSTIKV